MTIRKSVIGALVAGLLASSTQPSKAVFQYVPETSTAAVAAGVYYTGAFIGVVGLICAYDIVLKIQGLKNWDGTAKTAQQLRQRSRR